MNKINLSQKIAQLVAAQKSKSSFDRSIMHPEREWFVGVLMLILVMIVSFAWNIDHYNHYRNISLGTTIGTDEIVLYKENIVESALVDFAKRALEYDAIKSRLLNEQDNITAPREDAVVEEVEEVEELPAENQTDPLTPKEAELSS